MKQPELGDILFLDIETVSGKAKFEELSEEMQGLWAQKNKVPTWRRAQPRGFLRRTGRDFSRIFEGGVYLGGFDLPQ